ncbi:hypothetical protein V5799_018948 [Amblyomma americanum]|uniref:Major facilitator superfamily (MFS) profile domain-containing protein n=1 Tax=Amblyomma americanum TaxID=6943 RepID=A0AAQ4EZ57_AMBAM
MPADIHAIISSMIKPRVSVLRVRNDEDEFRLTSEHWNALSCSKAEVVAQAFSVPLWAAVIPVNLTCHTLGRNGMASTGSPKKQRAPLNAKKSPPGTPKSSRVTLEKRPSNLLPSTSSLSSERSAAVVRPASSPRAGTPHHENVHWPSSGKGADRERSPGGTCEEDSLDAARSQVAASSACLEELGGDLGVVARSTFGVLTEASDSSARDHELASPSADRLHRRVSFGAVTVSGHRSPVSPGATMMLDSLLSAAKRRASWEMAGTSAVTAASGSDDAVQFKSTPRQPSARNRADAMYDEFDTSTGVDAEADTEAADHDDSASHEDRARRRRSSAASGTSALSLDIDAPVFPGRVKPPLPSPATPQSIEEPEPVKEDDVRKTDASKDKTEASAPQACHLSQGADKKSSEKLFDEAADNTGPGSPEGPPFRSELLTPQRNESPLDFFSPPRLIGSIGSEELARESFSSRFTQSLSTALHDIVVFSTSRRFYMLAIFCAASLINGFQWIEYSIIANVIQDYYGVEEIEVAWTSLVFHIGCVTLALPSSWILENMGLRVTVLLGALGTSIGSCVKIFSVHPGRFNYVLLGQTFPAFSLAFIIGVPSRLASAWFKYEEVSTACSLGVLGNQIGIALGFIIPPYIVDPNNVHDTLTMLCVGVALVSFSCLFIVIVAFEDKPEHPPSFSEMLTRYAETKPSFSQALRQLVSDRDFRLLVLSYGINTGAFYSVSTLLNPVIVSYFPGEESFAGLLGLVLVLSGLLGSWAAGWFLDKTGRYKEVSVVTYAFATLGLFAYTFVLSLRSHLLTAAVCFFLGFFLAGYIPVGLQLGAEITYPLPEGTSASVLNMAAETFGFVLILCSSSIRGALDDKVSNAALSFLLLAGCTCIALLRATLKRKMATIREQRRRSAASAGQPGPGQRAPQQSPVT